MAPKLIMPCTYRLTFIKAPRHPGVEPRMDVNIYCRHCPPCSKSPIRLLLAVLIKSTRTIITNTKNVIIKACLVTDKISISMYDCIIGATIRHRSLTPFKKPLVLPVGADLWQDCSGCACLSRLKLILGSLLSRSFPPDKNHTNDSSRPID